MRNIRFFETKEQAKEFQKEHPMYRILDKLTTPYIDEAGKVYGWSLTHRF